MTQLRIAALVAAIAVASLWSTADDDLAYEQAQADDAAEAPADLQRQARVEIATQFAEASHDR